MPFLRTIYRLSLAVLLLGSLAASGNRAASMLHARQAQGTVQRADPDNGSSLKDGVDMQDCFLHVLRSLSPGHSDHDHRDFTDRHFYLFAGIDEEMSGCSKSELRKRLSALLDHFTYPQRLSLYPKHGFW